MESNCVLILGAGKINIELQSEFGDIAPSLIPLIDRCILIDKLELLKEAPVIYVVLNDIDSWLLPVLESNYPNVRPVTISRDSTLVDSILTGLRAVKASGLSSVNVHFVDTKVVSKNVADCIAVKSAPDDNRWTTVYRGISNTLHFEDFEKVVPRSKAVIGYFAINELDIFLKIFIAQLSEKLDDYRVALWETWKLYDIYTNNGVHLEEVEVWIDFGHLDSYYASRGNQIRGRSFNSFDFNSSRNMITKRSSEIDVATSEIEWYRGIPEHMKDLVPKYSSNESLSEYDVEFIPSITLAESLIYCKKDKTFWRRSTGAIEDALSRMRKTLDPDNDYVSLEEFQYDIYIRKSEKRISSFIEGHRLIDVKKISRVNNQNVPRFENLVEHMFDRLTKMIDGSSWSMIHGDFFLGNLLFDYRQSSLILIDPRGQFGKSGIFGDPRYDVGKLGQSILSRYDFLANNLFTARIHGVDSLNLDIHMSKESIDTNQFLLEWYLNLLQKFGYDLQSIKILTANLLLTCAELHKDNPRRQIALLASFISLMTECL